MLFLNWIGKDKLISRLSYVPFHTLKSAWDCNAVFMSIDDTEQAINSGMARFCLWATLNTHSPSIDVASICEAVQGV
ncbi:MAG: hypothetical protein Ta2B_28540 [Termitinemataceae bacterium]|nr:MAG: hypothetical protein Ta2B_28540 [Termitinemataceae bacterium]